MKKFIAMLVLATPFFAAGSITFTNDTLIRFTDTNYDGQDIALTNCTVTIDGSHSLSSVHVLNGARLTHSADADGVLENRVSVTNELLTLNGSALVSLNLSNVVIATLVVADTNNTVVYTNGVDYLVGVDTNGVASIQRTAASAIPDGATVQAAYEAITATAPSGLSLVVTNDVLVEAGGAIEVNGRGYGGGTGSGAGSSSGSPLGGGGGGYGGYGGLGASNAPGGTAFGSTLQPVDKGSGGGPGSGGPGGSGGGAINLQVGGVLRVDGIISARGGDALNTRSGGGSGGSIYMAAQTLQGGGSISADGGAGEPSLGGGGGGGRIALYAQLNNFLGALAARGGKGWRYGGAGTVYVKAGASVGTLVIDNGGNTGTNTLLSVSEPVSLFVKSGGIVSLNFPSTIGSLLVLPAGAISLSQYSLTVTGSATIQAGGAIQADGKGFSPGQGQGHGNTLQSNGGTIGSGAGYGGTGASAPPAQGGISYGTIVDPNLTGSGGGNGNGVLPFSSGGAGGGIVRMTVGGALLVNGTISSDGQAGLGEASGGGSGGSVWLTVGSLDGSGVISAVGGAGNGLGGSGGGGRIALIFQTNNNFTGILKAWGGVNATNAGGAGTIYTRNNLSKAGNSQVIVDNHGNAGTNTFITTQEPFDLTVQSGAVVALGAPSTLGALTVASNSAVLFTNFALVVTRDATILPGGVLSADGSGFPSAQGPGLGRSGPFVPVGGVSVTVGSGAGHGGFGAAGGNVTPGNPYDSPTSPFSAGSGGGGGSDFFPTNGGGAGGGILRLTVGGNLIVGGRISADGASPVGRNSGGGSGGAVVLSVGGLTGGGIISAVGGSGNALGGGGGGGRISVTFQSNAFAGAVRAWGGGSTNVGGAGTIYLKGNTQTFGQVIVDNGGRSGAKSDLTQLGSTVDLVVRGGAMQVVPGPFLNSLLVASNSWLVFSNASYTILGSATLDAGGGILAEGTGSAGGGGQGPGRTGSNDNPITGGGGGYGGYGGAGGTRSAFGGNVYGGNLQTLTVGSGGGSGSGLSPTNIGGAGGGSVRLSVNGTLIINGRITANGVSGLAPNCGGGSGGGISITAGNLAGTGVISANGGAGVALGGGGGGGRIVLQPTIYQFSGTVSAFGGAGANRGGAGVIYTRVGQQNPGMLLVDNGGFLGTNTSLLDSGSFDLTVTRGGVALHSNPSFTPRTLTIQPNGWVSVVNQVMNVSSSASIQAGGGIIADATGSTSGTGFGFFGVVRGGGGYGGAGGANPPNYGRSYGSLQSPTDMGSSGAGSNETLPAAAFSRGGGAVHVVVAGPLANDGRISANGGSGDVNGGGGSGGSVWISATTLLGSGAIQANGGAGDGSGGGGGGGRIAITCNANLFTGPTTAFGGAGSARGGAGTIYVKVGNQAAGLVTLDNGGQNGTNSSLGGFSSPIDLVLNGGARLTAQGLGPVRNLVIASNAFLTFSNQSSLLSFSGDVTVQTGGGMVADGGGFNPSQANGSGGTLGSGIYGTTGGGGGHGGVGAPSIAGALGGISTDSALAPTLSGGGGGSGVGIPNLGGAGGGVVNVNISGTLLLQGRISADGLPGVPPGSGGGAGGSINLTAGNLFGAGLLSANGGQGNIYGGGGGGGRILLNCSNNSFSGTMSAYAGNGGGGWGGAGTIYLKQLGRLIVDNGGSFGAKTPVADSGLVDLEIRNGALVEPANDHLTLSNLFIGANGILRSEKTNSFELAVLNNATIDLVGALTCDARGFAPANGPGAGLSTNQTGSGAGYGGAGGASAFGAGGMTYGSAAHPVDLGSGGGFGVGGTSSGSAGGGAIRLSVGRTLTINGNLTAEGEDGIDDSAGGGAGGSIWVNANVIAGSGVIAADGGSGELYQGGGGGGGRIALYSKTNNFAGTVAAVGGDGYSAGQNGTIFLGNVFDIPAVIGQTPSGVASNGVSFIDLLFNTDINPYSVSSSDVVLSGPSGAVSSVTFAAVSPTTLRVSFPLLTAPGDYNLLVGPQIEDLFGQPMSLVYTGSFTISVPVIQGFVTDTNGQPVPGIVMQPTIGSPATTDANGMYVLGYTPGSSIAVFPTSPSLMFVPGSIGYTNLSGSVSNQNYLAVTTIAPSLSSAIQGTNLVINWTGLAGVTYEVTYSTDLTNWFLYAGPLAGTNGPMQIVAPFSGLPIVFYRLRATN